MATAWKNSCFILSERSDFHMVSNLSMHILTSFCVDEILLPEYMKWFTNFRGLS